MNEAKNDPLTLGKLRDKILHEITLSGEDVEVRFGQGDLTLNRLKMRGQNLLVLECNEVYQLIGDPRL